MTDDGIDEDKDLSYQAAVAKRGASSVVKRLLNLVNEGAPSISDLAYAIRAREKEDFKIVEKVQRKRIEDPTYDVNRLRDIVGLRIVTLYRLDALEIIPRLIELIQANAGTDTALFESADLEEIKIYSTNPRGDAQKLPKEVANLFNSLGYGSKVAIDGMPSNYTSIHLVVWCRGRYRDAYRRVPVEIQIRTALEDAWGEIDHKLKYKQPTLQLPTHDAAALQACLTHLNVMKTFIDGAAQYADQVRLQADAVFNSKGTSKPIAKDPTP